MIHDNKEEQDLQYIATSVRLCASLVCVDEDETDCAWQSKGTRPGITVTNFYWACCLVTKYYHMFSFSIRKCLGWIIGLSIILQGKPLRKKMVMTCHFHKTKGSLIRTKVSLKSPMYNFLLILIFAKVYSERLTILDIYTSHY